MIAGPEIREARRLLKMPAFELARRCQVATVRISRADRAVGQPKMHYGTLTRIGAALETAGVEFINDLPDVRLNVGNL